MEKLSFEQIPELLRQTGEKYAMATAKYEFLDGFTKVKLAELAGKHDGSEAQKQRMALSDPEYLAHLHILEVARQDMLTHKVHMEAMQARFEWYRSQNAMKRAEMNLN